MDSTRCEYSEEKVKAMRGAKELYLMKISKLRDEIKKKYTEIHRLDFKIGKINTKLAVAEREQHLRKKLRRETRLLLLSLENVRKNVMFKRIYYLHYLIIMMIITMIHRLVVMMNL